MPQRAILEEGASVHAWDADDASWAAVRLASKVGKLTMPCCSALATAKTSSLGSRFFAHRVRADKVCNWAGESVEHERLKAAACRAARAMGYMADTEVTAPDQSWRADCLISDADGRPVMAVEVQLSRTPLDEIDRRHRGLRRHLPMSVWFLGPKFARRADERDDRPVFVLPGNIHLAEAEIANHVTDVLSGRVGWTPANRFVEHKVPFRLVGYRHRCTACGSTFAYMPLALLMHNEVRSEVPPEGAFASQLPLWDLEAALRRYRDRTGFPTCSVVQEGWRWDASTIYLCPERACRRPIDDCSPDPRIAHAWPGRTADGTVSWRILDDQRRPPASTGSWGPPRHPQAPAEPWREPTPDPEAWLVALQDEFARRAHEIDLDRAERERDAVDEAAYKAWRAREAARIRANRAASDVAPRQPTSGFGASRYRSMSGTKATPLRRFRGEGQPA